MNNPPVMDIQENTHPWMTVFQLAQCTDDPTSWRLTGGLMVQLHARLHNADSRPTKDADFLVDVLTHASEVQHVKSRLTELGFQLVPGTLTGYTTKMRRNRDSVDLLVDNHLSPFLRSRAILNGQRLLGMPGSRKALKRSMLVTLRHDDAMATICVPDLLGALLMKAASYRETSQDGRERHLQDAMRLASLINDPVEELARLDNTSRSDRKNVRTLTTELLERDSLSYAMMLDPEEYENAIATLRELSRLLDMPRRHGHTADYL